MVLKYKSFFYKKQYEPKYSFYRKWFLNIDHFFLQKAVQTVKIND